VPPYLHILYVRRAVVLKVNDVAVRLSASRLPESCRGVPFAILFIPHEIAHGAAVVWVDFSLPDFPVLAVSTDAVE
jgi:hypothetical protein